MSLVSIGPIELGALEHGNPLHSWGAGHKRSPFSIGGLLTWDHVKQLLALVGNDGAHRTVRGATGTVERIIFAGDLFADLSGTYVLVDFDFSPAKSHTMDENTAPFTLSGTYLGDLA